MTRALGDNLTEVGAMVWTQTLGLALEPAESSAPLGHTATVEGHVQISGTWSGMVILQCSAAAAQRATQRMFNLQDEGPTPQDVCDTVGELTNILGGNIKALLSNGGCSLSLPVVSHGESYSVSVPGARVVARQAFQNDGEPIGVTVLEAEPLPEPLDASRNEG